MSIKPCYYISATDDTAVVIATECLINSDKSWRIARSKRSESIEAARKLIPAEYHCIPEDGTSTIIIEWWISKPTWAEAMKG